ncbi:MAG: nucleotidyltransferase [Elusimicrobia bacterium CG_4_10_14_0_8_um_filter_37_32]|nr:MAG: nucleotidyltransferase [Elusimicrobia bacterium CG_4_10_14_0_8_um_filter_37_32]
MANKTDVINVAKKFCEEVKKNNVINIKAAYLFGSLVKNKGTKYSDIDLAIISPSFSGFKFDDRKKLNPFVLKINHSIEIHPFSDKEFNRTNPFISEILKSGKRIF